MKTKAYNSVRDMVQDTLGPEAAAGMDRHAAATELTFALTRMRVDRGMSQRQIAAAMRCSSSKVSRMEGALDADLSWGDIVGYASALGMRLHLSFDNTNLPAAQRIKSHVFEIKALLDELAILATAQHDDQHLVAKINQFYGEVLFNFLVRFGESCQKLPPDIVVGAGPAPTGAPLPAPKPGSLLPA